MPDPVTVPLTVGQYYGAVAMPASVTRCPDGYDSYVTNIIAPVGSGRWDPFAPNNGLVLRTGLPGSPGGDFGIASVVGTPTKAGTYRADVLVRCWNTTTKQWVAEHNHSYDVDFVVTEGTSPVSAASQLYEHDHGHSQADINLTVANERLEEEIRTLKRRVAALEAAPAPAPTPAPPPSPPPSKDKEAQGDTNQ